MNTIQQFSPPKLVFGSQCAEQLPSDLSSGDIKNVFLVTAPAIRPVADPIIEALDRRGVELVVEDSISAEPGTATLEACLEKARSANIEGVVGIGGGSVLDVAKAVAGLYHSDQTIQEVLGINVLNDRKIYLACLPTTSGTGSEVSPNAIFLDESDNLKKAIISPNLVPDAVYVDPLLTLTVPPGVTAASGIDALTHCLEAYTNKFAHPLVDAYAIKGISLISSSLQQAVEHGDDVEARTNVSLGSLFGGMCLGPVNTAAVHALAYPLQGEFKISHGLSVALLLPYVMEFNLPSSTKRYAEVAIALGARQLATEESTAQAGVERVRQLCDACGIPKKLSDLAIPEEAIDELTRQALTVTRLLKNNPREVTPADAKMIFRQAH